MSARNLTITAWKKDAKDPPLALAVPGLKLTGWWPRVPPDLARFDGMVSIWPLEVATLLVELDLLEDAEGHKHQICVYVRILGYPNDWLTVVRDSLQYFLDAGATIAWAGGWECFLRYSPTTNFDGCYAASTARTGFLCLGGLDDDASYLSEIPGIAQQLHAAVAKHNGELNNERNNYESQTKKGNEQNGGGNGGMGTA